MLHLHILQMHTRGDEMEHPSPTSRLGHAGFGPEGLGVRDGLGVCDGVGE